MIVLALILLLLGWLLHVSLLMTLGWIALVIGVVLLVVAYTGHGRYWY